MPHRQPRDAGGSAATGLNGKVAEALLGSAPLTANWNAILNHPEKPMVTSGILLGAPAVKTCGFGEAYPREIRHLIGDLLDAPTATPGSVADEP